MLRQQNPVAALEKPTLKPIPNKGEESNLSSHSSFQVTEYYQKRAVSHQSFTLGVNSRLQDQPLQPLISTEPIFSARVGVSNFLGETYQVGDLYRIWSGKCRNLLNL
jgi:hypothetical protein